MNNCLNIIKFRSKILRNSVHKKFKIIYNLKNLKKIKFEQIKSKKIINFKNLLRKMRAFLNYLNKNVLVDVKQIFDKFTIKLLIQLLMKKPQCIKPFQHYLKVF